MIETYTETEALETWSAAQCPFTIEYSRQTLDDIRMAVVDAFRSLPGGGAEIGGLLLGKFENQRLTITQHWPLESEHAFGPSFTLSPKDRAGLEELLGAVSRNFNDLQPVGWYHSHTRSGIALSEADVEVHNRYFREAWQVALVLRPSDYEPTRAGFFFRERDGSLRAESSYGEIVLDPLPVSLLPAGMPPPDPEPCRQLAVEGQVITVAAEPALPPPPVDAAAVATMAVSSEPPAEPASQLLLDLPAAAEPAPPPPPVVETLAEPPVAAEAPGFAEPRMELEPDLPSFLQVEPAPPRRWMGIAAGVAIVVALSAATYQQRANSHPRLEASVPQVAVPRPAAAHPVAARPAAVHSAAVQPAPTAPAPIHPTVPAAPEEPALRKQAAELGKKNAELGKENGELGKQNAELSKQNADLRQQKEDLAKQAAKLKTVLAAETVRAKNLQQQLEQLRAQQQRKRLANQSSAPLP